MHNKDVAKHDVKCEFMNVFFFTEQWSERFQLKHVMAALIYY